MPSTMNRALLARLALEGSVPSQEDLDSEPINITNGETATPSTLPLRIAAVFIILSAGLLGGVPPLFIRALRDQNSLITFLIRGFAAGVILALALVHIVPEAIVELTDIAGITYPLGGTCILFGITLMVFIEHSAHIMYGIPHSHHGHHGDDGHSHSHSDRNRSAHGTTAPAEPPLPPGSLEPGLAEPCSKPPAVAVTAHVGDGAANTNTSSSASGCGVRKRSPCCGPGHSHHCSGQQPDGSGPWAQRNQTSDTAEGDAGTYVPPTPPLPPAPPPPPPPPPLPLPPAPASVDDLQPGEPSGSQLPEDPSTPPQAPSQPHPSQLLHPGSDLNWTCCKDAAASASAAAAAEAVAAAALRNRHHQHKARALNGPSNSIFGRHSAGPAIGVRIATANSAVTNGSRGPDAANLGFEANPLHACSLPLLDSEEQRSGQLSSDDAAFGGGGGGGIRNNDLDCSGCADIVTAAAAAAAAAGEGFGSGAADASLQRALLLHCHPGHTHECVSMSSAPNWASAVEVTTEGGQPLRLRIVAYLFELGCIFHSFIIGLSLGVNQTSVAQVRALLIALSFHQALEALSLASVINTGGFSTVKAALMVLMYSVTCPAGVAIGIAIASSYDPESVKARAAQGSLNGVSGGMLLYISLVQLVAEDMGKYLGSGSGSSVGGGSSHQHHDNDHRHVGPTGQGSASTLTLPEGSGTCAASCGPGDGAVSPGASRDELDGPERASLAPASHVCSPSGQPQGQQHHHHHHHQEEQHHHNQQQQQQQEQQQQREQLPPELTVMLQPPLPPALCSHGHGHGGTAAGMDYRIRLPSFIAFVAGAASMCLLAVWA